MEIALFTLMQIGKFKNFPISQKKPYKQDIYKAFLYFYLFDFLL